MLKMPPLALPVLLCTLLPLLIAAGAELSSSNNNNNSYTTKEGCELLLKGSSDCICATKRIECGMLTLDSDSELYQITCNTYAPRIYDKLPQLRIGNISSLTLNNCPIVGRHHLQKRVLEQLGISNYSQLQIQSYAGKENNVNLLEQSFSNMPGFRSLSLAGFKSQLPGNFLENCTDLLQLTYLSNTNVPATLLHPLTKLVSLNVLVRNMEQVAGQIFVKQRQLQRLTLDCGRNGSGDASMLSSQELWHMPNLTIFELNNCGNNVPTELFWKSENLRYIAIHSNISYLGREFLKSQKYLLRLQLSRNNIARLPDELFHRTPLLIEIHLAHNNLDRIQSGLFDKINNLHILNLEYNPITTVASNAFASLTGTRIYLGELYKQLGTASWARSTNATLCEEEFVLGVCQYCKRVEYLDHFSDKENCNIKDDPGKIEDIALRRHIMLRQRLIKLNAKVERRESSATATVNATP